MHTSPAVCFVYFFYFFVVVVEGFCSLAMSVFVVGIAFYHFSFKEKLQFMCSTKDLFISLCTYEYAVPVCVLSLSTHFATHWAAASSSSSSPALFVVVVAGWTLLCLCVRMRSQSHE